MAKFCVELIYGNYYLNLDWGKIISWDETLFKINYLIENSPKRYQQLHNSDIGVKSVKAVPNDHT